MLSLIYKLNKSRLPAEYQEVEYLESTGTQYIDSGEKYKSNDEISITVAPKYTNVDLSFFGAYENSSSCCELSQIQNKYRGNVGSIVNDDPHVNINQKSCFEEKNGTWIKNGVTFGRTVDIDMTITAHLFGRNYPISQKLNSCRIYNLLWKRNGNTIHNFVPCYRKDDNVVGMYDLCNSGKNLFDKSKALLVGIRNETSMSSWSYVIIDDQELLKIIKPSVKYTISYDVECIKVPEHTNKYDSNVGFLIYSGVNSTLYKDVVLSEKLYLAEGEKIHIVKTFVAPNNIDNPEANYRVLCYTNRYIGVNGSNVSSNMIFSNIQIEEGENSTEYEPYPFYMNNGTGTFIKGEDVGGAGAGGFEFDNEYVFNMN